VQPCGHAQGRRPVPDVFRIDLLLALLLRFMRLWPASASPPARFAQCLARTQAALAFAIRATLAADGRARPAPGEADLIAWFNRHHPRSDKITAGARSSGKACIPQPPMQRSTPALQPGAHSPPANMAGAAQARAPP